jgi:hypothetical protein
MGTRESRHGTAQILFSSARILPRQLPACWLAGVAVAAVTGAGAMVRLLVAGELPGTIAWAAGALFLPSLAMALGVWSSTSKVYEGLLTALWYLGPMNHVPGLDFTGAASGSKTMSYALMYLVLAGAFLTAAFFGRSRQIGRS